MGKKGEIKWFNTGIKWIVSRQVWVFSNRGYLILLYSMLFSCQVSLGNKKFFCGMFCCSKWLLSVKPPGFCSQARGRGFVVLLRKFWTIVRDLFLKGSYCLSQRVTCSFFPPSKYFFLSMSSVLSKLLIFLLSGQFIIRFPYDIIEPFSYSFLSFLWISGHYIHILYLCSKFSVAVELISSKNKLK